MPFFFKEIEPYKYQVFVRSVLMDTMTGYRIQHQDYAKVLSAF